MDEPIEALTELANETTDAPTQERLRKAYGDLLLKQFTTLEILQRLFPDIAPEFAEQIYHD